jgi:putative ABC transport system permease protein
MKFAFRQLIKNPGFTVIALLTLALGIGVNTTTFTLVNALLFRLPPFPEPSRLVQVYGTSPQDQFSVQSPADVLDVVHQATSFQQIAPYCFNSVNLARPGEPANRVAELGVAGNFFTALGVTPLLGRSITPADDAPGHNDVVLVSEKFWRKNLAADPNALGRTLRVDGKTATIIGVVPEAAQDLMSWGQIELWAPLGYDAHSWSVRDNTWMNMLARLKPGVSLSAAQSEMTTIAARLAHDHPDTDLQRGLNVSLFKNARSEGSRRVLFIIMGLMLSVLLIACVNLANLQLARTANRVREHAVRIALGASRGQLIRQLLAESVLLSLIGGALGLLVAVWGNRLLGSRLQMGADVLGYNLPLDSRVVAFTFLASVGTGIVFGLMPAWAAAGTNVNIALKQSGRGTSGDRSKHRLRQALVVAEVALALALLSGAAYFVKGIRQIGRSDPGWRTANLLTGSFVLNWNTYTDNTKVLATVNRLHTALEQLPGVDHVIISGSVPEFGFSHRVNFLIQGQVAPAHGQEPLALAERTTPGFFSTLGITLLSGRDFSGADRTESKQVVIINAAMAAQFWPHGDAIGHSIGDPDPKNPQWREIVGIVADIRFPANLGPMMTQFETYRPIEQDPEHWLAFTLHAKGRVESLADDARKAVAKVDPDLAVYNLLTVDDSIEKSSANMYVVEGMLTIAAGLGLLLALVGIYGVVANLAVQRTQEIGIRMALGAQSRSVLWLILKNGAWLASLGTAIGLILAFALSKGLTLAMPEIEGQDSIMILTLAVLLAGATLLACWLPALRATRVNPVEALRAE